MNRSNRFLIPTQAGIAVRVGIGVVLLVFRPDGLESGAVAFVIGMTVLSCVPYAVTYFLTEAHPMRGAIAAVTALVADTIAFAVLISVFWTQYRGDGSIVVATPFLNLLLFIPIAYIGTATVQKLLSMWRGDKLSRPSDSHHSLM